MDETFLNNITDYIILNQELLDSNKLSISGLYCTHFNSINLIGDITTQQLNINKPVVIGAYIVKEDKIIQVAATSFILKKQNTRFLLSFDDKKFDKIYLYADILNNTTEIIEEKNKKPVDELQFNNFPLKDEKPPKKMGMLERLKNMIEIDESMNNYGLKFEKTNIIRKYEGMFTIFSELHCKKNINKYGTIDCVIYDKYDNILDVVGEFVDLKETNGIEILEWNFENKPSQVEKIKMFPKFSDYL